MPEPPTLLLPLVALAERSLPWPFIPVPVSVAGSQKPGLLFSLSCSILGLCSLPSQKKERKADSCPCSAGVGRVITCVWKGGIFMENLWINVKRIKMSAICLGREHWPYVSCWTKNFLCSRFTAWHLRVSGKQSGFVKSSYLYFSPTSWRVYWPSNPGCDQHI